MSIVFKELISHIKKNRASLSWEIDYRNRNGGITENKEKIEHISLKCNNKIFAFINVKGEIDIPKIETNSILNVVDRNPTKYLVEHFNLKANESALRILPSDNKLNEVNISNFINYVNEYINLLKMACKKRNS